MKNNNWGRVVGCWFYQLYYPRSIFLLALFTTFSSSGFAQQELEILALKDNLHVIVGAGANIVVQHGPDGVVAIDSGSGARNEEVLAAIESLSEGRKIRYIINTSSHPDHVGGNETFSAAGVPFASRNIGTASRNFRVNSVLSGGAIILAQENVLFQMLEQGFPPLSWPQESYMTPVASLRLNGEGIEIRHVRSAYSNADSIIDFRSSDVIVVGEIINANRFPRIDIANGGSVDGLLEALTDLIWNVIPQLPLSWREGGTLVVPAEGRILQRNDIVQYRDMVKIIRDRVYALIEQGMTLEEIQVANPAFGFVGLYGDDSDDSDWTTSMFIEAVYTNLMTEM